MAFFFQNCSDLLWEKIVLVIEQNSRLDFPIFLKSPGRFIQKFRFFSTMIVFLTYYLSSNLIIGTSRMLIWTNDLDGRGTSQKNTIAYCNKNGKRFKIVRAQYRHKLRIFICIFRWFRIFQTSRYQGIVKATASGVFGDLNFKISELSDQNWSCLEPARQTQDNFNFGPSLLKF